MIAYATVRADGDIGANVAKRAGFPWAWTVMVGAVTVLQHGLLNGKLTFEE